jgi:CBS domain-containing protein
MSARAACRLETLGYGQVYDYQAGKNDWLAAGLPRAGILAGFPRAGEAVRRDVPTCGLTDRVGDVASRVAAAGWDVCVVVNAERIVLGILRDEALHGAPDATAEAAMEAGPTTFRPSEMLADVATHLAQARVRRVLLTTPEGRLIGMLDRDEAARRTGASAAAPPI